MYDYIMIIYDEAMYLSIDDEAMYEDGNITCSGCKKKKKL
jgi:hypothetical protein